MRWADADAVTTQATVSIKGLYLQVDYRSCFLISSLTELWTEEANMLRKMYLVALISLVHVLTPSEAKPCFITNCPPGGKRSSAVVPFIPPPVVEPQVIGVICSSNFMKI